MRRVLIIAGSDSGGGAGIQGDIKTVSALGGFATTAITALTAQNTLRVSGIYPVPADFVAQQIQSVLEDIGTDAVKTGMLHSKAVIEAVVEAMPIDMPLVVDPVMVAKGGAKLLEDDAVHVLKMKLIPLATIVTPNLPEAALMLGREITTPEEMEAAAEHLLALGSQAVLLKGGHLPGEMLTDILLIRGEKPVRFTAERVNTTHTHGTGCAIASAIATGLAQEMPLVEAVSRAHEYVQGAIKRAPGFGEGSGPLGF